MDTRHKCLMVTLQPAKESGQAVTWNIIDSSLCPTLLLVFDCVWPLRESQVAKKCARAFEASLPWQDAPRAAGLWTEPVGFPGGCYLHEEVLVGMHGISAQGSGMFIIQWIVSFGSGWKDPVQCNQVLLSCHSVEASLLPTDDHVNKSMQFWKLGLMEKWQVHKNVLSLVASRCCSSTRGIPRLSQQPME